MWVGGGPQARNSLSYQSYQKMRMKRRPGRVGESKYTVYRVICGWGGGATGEEQPVLPKLSEDENEEAARQSGRE